MRGKSLISVKRLPVIKGLRPLMTIWATAGKSETCRSSEGRRPATHTVAFPTHLTKRAASVKPQHAMDESQFELDVLAVFSHPDDAELSVSGTLLKLKSLGYRSAVLDMTRGEMGTRGTPEGRAEEAREAARIMGLDVRLNLEQPDGHVWVTEEARTALVRVVRACKPKVILTAHWDDPHPDHANTARIV